MKIIIINQSGNIKSIENMIKKCGFSSKISDIPEEILEADKLILPGVGSFDHSMIVLKEKKIDVVIKDFVINKNKQLLGICLGMQLLFNNSEEGKQEGLGLIDGQVKKFKFDNTKYKIPHMGWNFINKNSNFTKFNLSNDRFYFAHSYYVEPNNKSVVTYNTDYYLKFPSIIENGNISGFQFHPEKSHKFGQKLLKQFLLL